jgi:hypothetical protein
MLSRSERPSSDRRGSAPRIARRDSPAVVAGGVVAGMDAAAGRRPAVAAPMSEIPHDGLD